MTTITPNGKRKVEKDMIAEFPNFANRIGLNGYSCVKVNQQSEVFHMNDKDKTYFFTPPYRLDAGFGEFDAGQPIELKIAATLFKNNTLTIHNMTLEFHDKDDQLLFQLVHLHDLSSYLANFKEMEAFILARSDIVERVIPTLQFNFVGELIDIGISFKYFEENPLHYINNFTNHAPKSRYYTNTMSLYNTGYNQHYTITNPAEAMIFAKMTFLSIHDEKIQEIFECTDWLEMYEKLKKSPEEFLSLYDMTKF